MGVRSFLWRKWKRSSFDSVAGNMRTGTLTRPKEIVPLQIGRMAPRYPPEQVFQPERSRQSTVSKEGFCPPKSFSTQRGGRLFGPVFRPEVVLRSGEKAVDVVERRQTSRPKSL